MSHQEIDCSDSDDDLFYFESQRLAVCDNADYRQLIQAMARLQGQHDYTRQRIAELQRAKSYYMQHTDELIAKLKRGEHIVPPKIDSVVTLPELDLFNELLTEHDDAASTSTVASKSTAQRKPWSDKEQQQLEKLMLEHTSELGTQCRLRRIARALKHRTTDEVAERMRKCAKQRSSSRRNSSRARSRRRHCSDASASSGTDDAGGSDQLTLNECKQIELLQRIRDEKARNDKLADCSALNAKPCTSCSQAPVPKRSWYCGSCKYKLSLCLDCLTDQLLQAQFEHLLHDLVIN